MRTCTPGRPVPRLRRLLAVLALPALASAQAAAQSGTTPPAALAACSGIADSAARLACYDKLAGRGAAPAVPARSAPAPQPAGAPAAVAAAAAPKSTTTPGSTAPAAEVPAPATPVAPAPSAQSFGLYSAEHPKAPAVSPTLESRVVALGRNAGGRMTVTLDGGAVWEMLDDGDPLLAVGDAVTVKRAALGSYLMSTPTKRTHRVERLD